MKTGLLVAIVAGAVACAAFVGPSSAQQEGKAVAKWEYKRAENPKDADLTRLGNEGWELVIVVGGQPYVASFPSGTGNTPNPNAVTVNKIEYAKAIYVFKRPKP